MSPRGSTAKGCYVLLIGLPADETVTAGRLGPIRFRGGHYAYVGSALGGLRSRLNRHLRSEKKAHWHIDYLLEKARISEIVTCETDVRVECVIARALWGRFDSVAGFGSSDCRCRSHLFFSTAKMTETVVSILEELRLSPGWQRVQRGQDYPSA